MLPEDLSSPAAGRLRSAPSVRSVSLGAMSRDSASLLSLSPSEPLGLRWGSPGAAGGAPARWAAGSGSGGGSLSFWACASLECRHFIRRFWNHTFTCGRAALRRAVRPLRAPHRAPHRARPCPFHRHRQRGQGRRRRPPLPLPTSHATEGLSFVFSSFYSVYLNTAHTPARVCLFVCLDGFFPLSFYFFFQETKSCSRNHSVIQFCALRALDSGIITEWRLMIPFEEVFSLPQNEGFHNERKDLEQKKIKNKKEKKKGTLRILFSLLLPLP